MTNVTTKNVIVAHSEKGWTVTREGNKHPSDVKTTQREAVARGRELATHTKSNLVIQTKEGKVSRTVDYVPPKPAKKTAKVTKAVKATTKTAN